MENNDLTLDFDYVPHFQRYVYMSVIDKVRYPGGIVQCSLKVQSL